MSLREKLSQFTSSQSSIPKQPEPAEPEVQITGASIEEIEGQDGAYICKVCREKDEVEDNDGVFTHKKRAYRHQNNSGHDKWEKGLKKPDAWN